MQIAADAKQGPDRLFRMPAVRQFAGGVTGVTIYGWMKQGKFPRPVKIGRRAVAWRERDLVAWQAERGIGGSAPQK